MDFYYLDHEFITLIVLSKYLGFINTAFYTLNKMNL